MSIAIPLTRPLVRPLTRAITEAGVGIWHPSHLFAGGVKGIALDLTDISKLYQNIARTTPVTATGQPIGGATDVSGNGAHPVAAADNTTRPTYDGWATFDGSNDSLSTPTIDFSGSDQITVVVGLRKDSDASVRFVCELSADINSNNGSFYLAAPGAAATNFDFRSKGTTSSGATIATPYTSPVTSVVTATSDISTPTALIYVDGTLKATNSNTQGTGNFGNHKLYIGSRFGAGFFLLGRIYRLIVIGRALTALERANAEAWCGDPFT